MTLLMGTGIALWSAFDQITMFLERNAFDEWYRATSGTNDNPEVAIVTLFNTWIGQDYSAVATTIFYTLFPILCVLPYAWSFFSERTSGYMRQLVARSDKVTYFIAKYVATFASGALALVIPMLINFMVVSSFIPAITPDINYDIYYNVPYGSLGAAVFYDNPFLFVLMRFVIALVYGGLIAASVIAISFFVKNRFAILLIPFIILILLNYFSEAIGHYFDAAEISPISFLGGTSTRFVTPSVVIIFAIGLFAFSLGITLWRGSRDDVF